MIETPYQRVGRLQRERQAAREQARKPKRRSIKKTQDNSYGA
jgi:hypothetical protein